MTRYLLINGKRYEIEFDSSIGGNYNIGPESSLPADAVLASYPELVEVDKDKYASDDTNISIEEIYNQLSITCELTEIDELISSPLSDDDLFSPFSNSQIYCREYATEGEGKTSLSAFQNLLVNNESDYDKATKTDWFV